MEGGVLQKWAQPGLLSGLWPLLLLGGEASVLQMGVGWGLVASWCFSPQLDFESPLVGRADRRTVPPQTSLAPPVWPGPAPPTRRWAEQPRAPGWGLRRLHVVEGVAGGHTGTGKTHGFPPPSPEALPPHPPTTSGGPSGGQGPILSLGGGSSTSDNCVLFLEGGAVLQSLPPPNPLPSLLALYAGS